jgi:hypothetical protein
MLPVYRVRPSGVGGWNQKLGRYLQQQKVSAVLSNVENYTRRLTIVLSSKTTLRVWPVNFRLTYRHDSWMV